MELLHVRRVGIRQEVAGIVVVGEDEPGLAQLLLLLAQLVLIWIVAGHLLMLLLGAAKEVGRPAGGRRGHEGRIPVVGTGDLEAAAMVKYGGLRGNRRIHIRPDTVDSISGVVWEPCW